MLENIGTEPVQILSSSVIGASDQVWQLSSDGRLSLGAGDYSSFELRFEPVELGPVDVRIQIRLDMDDLPVVTVDAKGVGGLSIRDGDGDGYSPAEGDCDDFNAAIYPAADEVCDGYDNNCDDIFPDVEEDRDGDGWMPCSGDCDDQNADVFPDAPELCDDLDNDCDGVFRTMMILMVMASRLAMETVMTRIHSVIWAIMRSVISLIMTAMMWWMTLILMVMGTPLAPRVVIVMTTTHWLIRSCSIPILRTMRDRKPSVSL